MQWRWARAHDTIDITGEGGALATRKRGWGWLPAVCGEVLQAEGEAYAEFTWVSGDYLMVGVARAGVDPSSVGVGLHGTADGWMYYCYDGEHWHNDWQPTPWASSDERGPRIAEGETVGLLLRRGSLSVHIGGRQVGVMCTGLSGSLVWAADLLWQQMTPKSKQLGGQRYFSSASSVRIARNAEEEERVRRRSAAQDRVRQLRAQD